MKQNPYKIVIFDLDGVLIDSMPVIRIAFETAYREAVDRDIDQHAIDILFKNYCKYLGHGFTNIMDKMGLPHNLKEPFVRVSRDNMDKIILYDGVLEILEHLKQKNVLMTVATGKDGYRAREILSRLGILDYFSAVTGSDESPHAKPAPDMLLLQLKMFDLQPEDGVMIGDSPADIEAGEAAGMTTIGALWGYGNREALARANLLFENVGDINHLISPF